jgi:hypothetical protein
MTNTIIYKEMKWIKLDENNIQWYDFMIAMGVQNYIRTGNVFASGVTANCSMTGT